MEKKSEKKLEETKEVVEEVTKKEAKISLLGSVFNRQDLNDLKDKVNEIVEFLNK